MQSKKHKKTYKKPAIQSLLMPDAWAHIQPMGVCQNGPTVTAYECANGIGPSILLPCQTGGADQGGFSCATGPSIV